MLEIPTGLQLYNFSSAILTNDSHLYIAGGVTHNFTYMTNNVIDYNLEKNTFNELPGLLSFRYNLWLNFSFKIIRFQKIFIIDMPT